jgi:flagellar hook assembly protein FlgD
MLYANYPNPFNPTTTISFSLPAEENIEVAIYNIKGQKVKTLYSGIAEEGKHTVIWNGKDENEKSVSSGIYFYKLKAGKQEMTRKMLLLK